MKAPKKNQVPRFLVGIDLGTTHTVVAYCDTEDKAGEEIKLFPIEQLVAPGELNACSLLPSVRYHPAPGELAKEDIQLPWPTSEFEDVPEVVLGELARSLGAKAQGRLVTSAKSWLSHGDVDRTAAILPWATDTDAIKVSPVTASASYLAHVRSAWNKSFSEYPLEKQELVITIPASFDEVARSLTIEAAKLAGLPNIRLLEEPQAVCYDWLNQNRSQISTALGDIQLILVCDIGGGTTDLTLIKVTPGEKEPKLTRVGVGNHLMLGGDNIDLTLAHHAEKRIVGENARLSGAELFQLIEQCRIAKEALLADDAPEIFRVTLLGSGSRLIGGARSTEFSRQEINSIVLEGFFPESKRNEFPSGKRSGVVEFGLPYASEPAISKHIAAFLRDHQSACEEALSGNGQPAIPDALLLNGGMFRSQTITKRLFNLLSEWRGSNVTSLDNHQPDLAVAYGAVAYSKARLGEQIKIAGGSARSYFLSLEHNDKENHQGVCLLPRGSDEGEEIVLTDRQFSLRLGQPVRFNLVSSTGDTPYQSGQLVPINSQNFLSLPPLDVAFDGENMGEGQETTVQLAASLTEIGTLQIQCVSVKNQDKRWNVEFQLRGRTTRTLTNPQDSSLPDSLENALMHIQLIFGKKSKEVTPKAVKAIRINLEKILGPRKDWNTLLLRELSGVLLDAIKYRRRTANHERGWLSLTGFCLRPGFGNPLDDWRIEQLWSIYNQNIQFVNESQNWSEWWTLWRRVAGGLDESAQKIIFNDIKNFVNPVEARKGKIANLVSKRGYDDIIRLAAVLERLPVENKISLGNWLLIRLSKASEPKQTWWAVGRVGARIPFHGSNHNVVPRAIVVDWLETMLDYDWKKTIEIGFAAAILARKSNDRDRDI
ncbi:MAG: Hsp70 family protein, partial [Methylococcales bacterium]